MKIKSMALLVSAILLTLSSTANARWAIGEGTVQTVMSVWNNTLVAVFKKKNGNTEKCYIPKSEVIQIDAVLLASTTKQNVKYWCDTTSNLGYAQSLKLHRIDLK